MFDDKSKTMFLSIDRADQNWGERIQINCNGEGETWLKETCECCGAKLELQRVRRNRGGGTDWSEENKMLQRNATDQDGDTIMYCEEEEEKEDEEDEQVMYGISAVKEEQQFVMYNIEQACSLADEAVSKEEGISYNCASNTENEKEDVSAEDHLLYEFLNEVGLANPERPAITSCWEEEFRKLEDGDQEPYFQIPNIPEVCTCDAQHCFPYCGCIFYAQGKDGLEEAEY
jgi:hypothetical protein